MMKTRIATILLLSLTAFTFLLSCNLDGEGAFYSIATAKEITTGSGYAQIEKVLRYDGTTAYVQAGKRISYKNATDEDFTDVDLPDEISSVEEVVFDGTNYYILSLDVDTSVHKLYEVPTNASTANPVLVDKEILMLLEANDTAYAVYDDDGDLKLEDVTNSSTIDIDDTDLSGDLTSSGSFIVHDGTNTHLFLTTDEDKLFHSTDFINFTDISSSSIKPVGGIALGADVHVYGYTQTSESFAVYDLNGASTFDTAVATLSTETPKLSEAGLPTVVVDDGSDVAKTILIYVTNDNLVEFKPDASTKLAFASGYGLEDERILSFHRITDNEFLTSTNGSGLLKTVDKETDGF